MIRTKLPAPPKGEVVAIARSYRGRHLVTEVIAEGSYASVNAAQIQAQRVLKNGRHPSRGLQRAYRQGPIEFATVLAEHRDDAIRYDDEFRNRPSYGAWANPGRDV